MRKTCMSDIGFRKGVQHMLPNFVFGLDGDETGIYVGRDFDEKYPERKERIFAGCI